ncbi:MAG: 2,3-bisphosphoglycerate-independent phosphoglycerate mutase [Planctomycetes bacterium]|nr:2,3-bisphosphoglycerate-independent phosphoglycerate mutase [Planctomycetota bacterium]
MAKPLILLIRDGWGIGPVYEGNAVRAANTPNMDRLLAEHPNCVLEASGTAVGVRAGGQGSSEVGHLNMGAGRIVEQEILRVDKLIASGELFKAPRLVEAVKLCKSSGAAFHLMGLVQDQGVHATQEHLFAILAFLAREGLEKVFIHFFGDGRDTPPRSAIGFLEQLQQQIAELGVGRVAGVMGRYWSMDRGRNWSRTERAYRAMLYGEGFTAKSAREAIEAAYERADRQIADGEDLVETDEFIQPTIIVDNDGKPLGLIAPGDAVLHFNYRQDRALQLTEAFVEKDFDGFARGDAPAVFYMGLTQYYDDFKYPLVPAMNMKNLLGEVLSTAGLMQLRIAEFQKYRHVTSFFNGKRLEAFPGEDRIEVSSITIPEDQKPEMSAYEVTELMLCAIKRGIAAVRAEASAKDWANIETCDPPGKTISPEQGYDVIVLNYANGDMVGHTGVFDAAVKAVETVDECVGKVVEATLSVGGTMLITADHGNVDEMIDRESGAPSTAHTTNDVEFVLVANDSARYKLTRRGKLSNIAPTMLDIMGMDIPADMTEKSLIE